MYVRFDGNYLKQDKITFSHGKTENIYIVYEITKNNPTSSSYPVLENYLFGEIGLIKNSTIDEYNFSGYGIGLYRKGSFSHQSGEFGQNVIIFGVDMSSSPHANNKKQAF